MVGDKIKTLPFKSPLGTRRAPFDAPGSSQQKRIVCLFVKASNLKNFTRSYVSKIFKIWFYQTGRFISLRSYFKLHVCNSRFQPNFDLGIFSQIRFWLSKSPFESFRWVIFELLLRWLVQFRNNSWWTSWTHRVLTEFGKRTRFSKPALRLLIRDFGKQLFETVLSGLTLLSLKLLWCISAHFLKTTTVSATGIRFSSPIRATLVRHHRDSKSSKEGC